MSPTLFIPFNRQVPEDELPTLFNYPFYFKPHALCVEAATALQSHLLTQTQWYHNFGLADDAHNIIGKMFGVLVVKQADGHVGYLAAFSGKLAEKNELPGFVPPVFDLLSQDGAFFQEEQREINRLNEEVDTLEASADFLQHKVNMENVLCEAKKAIEEVRQQNIKNKAIRKRRRDQDSMNQYSTERDELLAELAKESVADKNNLIATKQLWQQRIDEQNTKLLAYTSKIDGLKAERKARSSALQDNIFKQYRFLNANGEEQNLLELFADMTFSTPPAGAGECAAPKLLQYAYQHELTPIAFAEFWWGQSPKSEVRKHGQFYPACQGKCQPILSHMLKGLAVEPNPLLDNPAKNSALSIVYQDEHIVIVNKPAELLSVPGKHISDSVLTRMRLQFPSADSPLIVHRLDMSTSGLMVIALTQRAHKHLQKQFIERQIQKQYLAMVDGEIKEEGGELYLPLRGDLYDRPRQLVCHQYGKSAHTTWTVVERFAGKTLLRLYPHTGRTHQLRVHCAHHEGLNMPIIGDDLYGDAGERLHLHAESMTLTHPVTKETMTFTAPADFAPTLL